MIKRIGIHNFKAFGELHYIDFSNLTLLSGLNSSGKSSIYQVLLLLTQSFESSRHERTGEVPILTLNGDLLQLGKKEEILNDQNTKSVRFDLLFTNNVELDLEFTLHTHSTHGMHSEDFMLTRLKFLNNRSGAKYDLKYNLKSNGWSIKASSVLEISERSFERVFHRHLKDVTPKDAVLYNPDVEFSEITGVTFFGYDLLSFKIKNEDLIQCINPEYRDKLDIAKIKELYLKENNTEYNETHVTLENNYKITNSNLLFRKDIKYIPPFRGYPRRFYTEGSINNPLIEFNKHQNEKVKYHYDMEKKVANTSKLSEALHFWIVDQFKFAEEVKVDEAIPGYTSEIFLLKSNKKIPINNMGFGVSQILPIVFNLLQANSSRIFIVDEPEIHLHPEIQSKLADFFIHMALVGKTIILESHSEYLINSLVYYMVKYPHLKDSMKLYWVEQFQSSAKTKEITFDEFGFMDNAPMGFLTESESTTDKLNALRLQKMSKSNG
ncbi:ATP-binding protein [Bdellovibrio bacteriovorus]|uniref:ATP-binding protein n=1 Tax=Bdellovibrio bacteriovorus TaxID=959 RepID=UPI0021D26F04|nr:ATP-binding protein [Bdellovibrio bacteriovorus]UXR66099.1 ATP-binding protein [Bdellovibrio bacteriovorus]